MLKFSEISLEIKITRFQESLRALFSDHKHPRGKSALGTRLETQTKLDSTQSYSLIIFVGFLLIIGFS